MCANIHAKRTSLVWTAALLSSPISGSFSSHPFIVLNDGAIALVGGGPGSFDSLAGTAATKSAWKSLRGFHGGSTM